MKTVKAANTLFDLQRNNSGLPLRKLASQAEMGRKISPEFSNVKELLFFVLKQNEFVQVFQSCVF